MLEPWIVEATEPWLTIWDLKGTFYLDVELPSMSF